MVSKKEIINNVYDETNLDVVVSYLSDADLTLENLNEVLDTLPELSRTRLGSFATQSYEYKLLKRTLSERAKIAEPNISWNELCGVYNESHYNVEYFM